MALFVIEVAAIVDARQVHPHGDEVSTSSDIVLMATGVTPEVHLAPDAGLRVDIGRMVADAT